MSYDDALREAGYEPEDVREGLRDIRLGRVVLPPGWEIRDVREPQGEWVHFRGSFSAAPVPYTETEPKP